MAKNSSTNTLTFLENILELAKKKGATDAAVSHVLSEGFSVSVRNGKPQSLETEKLQDISFDVYIGNKKAEGALSSLDMKAIEIEIDAALQTARLSTDDPYDALAAPNQVAKNWTAPDMEDRAIPTESELLTRAQEIEEATLAVPGVSQSESGAHAGWQRHTISLMATNGFVATYARTNHSNYISAIAKNAKGQETDYAYSSSVFGSDLESPADTGRLAGERAVAKLDARKMPSAQVPVVFDSRISAGLLGAFATAASGMAMAFKQSFLTPGDLNKPLFPENITIIDDPLMARGLASRPFDDDFLPSKKNVFVEKGILKRLFLNLNAARRLEIDTKECTGDRPSNLYMLPGKETPEELIADIKDGLYVTETMGHGLNPITGDYSVGASGHWIKNGKIAFPVAEITIAGNMRDMFASVRPANDLQLLKSSKAAPTLRIEGMMVAGL